MEGVEEVGRDEFEQWLDDRPQWVQTAASRLISAVRRPTPEEISALASICIAEATGRPDVVLERMPTGALGSTAAGLTMKLLKVDEVQGVNAIKAGAALEFGDSNLVVVYGMNGAGKSGFSRLIKSVCGTRSTPDIHPNVFSDVAAPASAVITASLNEAVSVLPWSVEQGAIPKLRNVQVFDSLTANSYVQSKSEASYEPRRMRFLSTLIRVVDEVAAEIGRRKAVLPSLLPVAPPAHVGTKAAAFLKSVRHATKQPEVDAACAWTAQDDQRRLEIETTLKQVDVPARQKVLNADKSRLVLLKNRTTSLKDGLSQLKAAELVAARMDARAKRKAASEDAEKVFVNSALDGVGKDSWRLLWEQARVYSETFAYPEEPFPVADEPARCVLCHQQLDEGARSRMKDFEAFVKGGLETVAKEAEQTLQRLMGELPAFPPAEQWKVDVEFLRVDPQVGEGVLKAIALRLEAMNVAASIAGVPPVDWSVLETAITSLEELIAKEEQALADLQKDGKRQELEQEFKELKARAWLSEQKALVEGEIIRLKSMRDLDAAEKLARTNALTQKKNDLARDELANGYRDRFAAELELLGGKRIPVVPEPVPEGKGKVNFQLTLKGAKRKVHASSILSEGEGRIVALAAFIADMLGSGHSTPFVFDDPVSSLDQEFEERVVGRLVALSKTRQVIVFTHRLSLLALLEDAVKKHNEFAAVHGQEIAEPTVISVRRLGSVVGVTEDLSARNKKPAPGFKALRDHRLPMIKKFHEGGLTAEYDFAMKAACSDFRILVERSIEYTLLCDVVGRFRRSVKTLLLRDLAKIRAEDCAFLDELMTRYSRFEHSQSDEIATELPDPDELEKDLENAIAWCEEFSKRKST